MRGNLHVAIPRKQIIRFWPAAAESWDLTTGKRRPVSAFRNTEILRRNRFRERTFSLSANTCMKTEKHSASCSFWSPVPSPPAAHSSDLMDYLTASACPPGTCPTCRRSGHSGGAQHVSSQFLTARQTLITRQIQFLPTMKGSSLQTRCIQPQPGGLFYSPLVNLVT